MMGESALSAEALPYNQLTQLLSPTDEELSTEISPVDDPDDLGEIAEEILPLVAALPLPARPATCPRASCLKRNVSGSSDVGGIFGSPTPSLTAVAIGGLSGSNSDGTLSDSNVLASPVMLSSPSSSSTSESDNSAISTSISFKCFPGQPLAPKRQVHFADATPEAGLTWNGSHYDRRPIESTQVKGSALDLSMRRCKSQCEDEQGDDEAEDQEQEGGSGAEEQTGGCPLSQLAKKVNHAGDYFGSSWARFKAGTVIGYDARAGNSGALIVDGSSVAASRADAADQSTSEAGKDEKKTALPTHSFRCFGGLSGSSILGGNSSDEEEREVLDSSSSIQQASSSNEPKSADATPMQSPSVARSLMLRRSYFSGEEEDGSASFDQQPPSPSKPELQVDTAQLAGSPSPSRSSLDADKTPTQSKARIPLQQDGTGEVPSDVVIKLSSSLHSTIGLVIPTSLTASALRIKQLEASQLSHPSSPGSSAHHDSASETSTSATSFTTDQDSPPLSWLGGSSGCTSPQSSAPVALAAMARSLSVDSTTELNGEYSYKQPQVTQEDLGRIPKALGVDAETLQHLLQAGATVVHADGSSSDDEATSRLADRLAVAETLNPSCSSSSSPLFLTDDESVEAVQVLRQANRSKTRSVSESYISRVLAARSGMISPEDSGSGSCSGTDSSSAAAASSSAGGEVVKKRKKKKCPLGKPSAFRCASFDDYEGALGGF